MTNVNIFKIKIFQPNILQQRLHRNIGNQATQIIKKKSQHFNQALNNSQSIINMTPNQKPLNLNNSNNLFTVNYKSKQIDPFQSYRSSSSFRSHRPVKRSSKNQALIIQFNKKKIPDRPQSAMLKKSRKRSWEHYKNKLAVFAIDDILFKKNQSLLEGEGEQCVAFSKENATFVRVVKSKDELEWEPFHNQFVVKIYGRMFIRNQLYFVVQNFNKTSMRDIIDSFGVCKQSLVRKQIRNLVCGVIHCHNRGIVHNRINPNNIYMNKDGNLLIDIIKSNLNPPTQKQKQMYYHYFSPELLTEDISAESCDVWAIGCLTLQMLTGKIKTSVFHPYHQSNDASPSSNSPTLKQLKQQGRKYTRSQTESSSQNTFINNQSNLTKSAHSFIAACLKVNYNTRPQLSILIDHDFLRVNS